MFFQSPGTPQLLPPVYSWVAIILACIGTFLSGGGLVYLLNRKKLPVEIDSLRLNSAAHMGESFSGMIARLQESQGLIDRLRAERDKERELREAGDRLNSEQIRKLRALLILHNINYAEGDPEIKLDGSSKPGA